MNETRVRALVPIIIIVAAIGIGIFLWVRYMPRQEGNTEMGSGSILRSEFMSDTIFEPSEKTTEQKKEIIIGSLDPGLRRDDKADSPVIPSEAMGPDVAEENGIPKEILRNDVILETIEPKPAYPDDKLKNALTKAADSEDYTALGAALAEMYKRYPQGKKEFAEIESRAYVKATGYLDQEKNTAKALAAADAVYGKYPFGWRFKYLRVRVLERLGRDAFAVGDLASAEKHALTMLGMEFRPEGANLMADIYLKRIDAALAKGDSVAAKAAYDEIKDYEVSPELRAALDERFEKILGL